MTSAPIASSHRFVIDKWHVTYRVPKSVPFTHADRHRLDERLRSEIATALARSVELSIDAADPSVWRIRSLTVDLSQPSVTSLGSASNHVAMHHDWAIQLAGAILGEMNDDVDSSRVLRFPSRADYLARFLVDLVGGRAWDRWYFEEFESLRPLSTSQVICEALLQQEVDVAKTLIALLAIRGLHGVLEALSLGDSKRVFDSWLKAGTAATSSSNNAAWIARLLEIWVQTPYPIRGKHPWRDGVWWLATAASHYEDFEFQRESPHVVAALLNIRSFFLSLPSRWHRGRIIQLIAQSQLTAAAQLVDKAHFASALYTIETFATMMEGDLDWGLSVISILTGDQYSDPPDTSAVSSNNMTSHLSHFAGVFRLASSFVAVSATQVLAAAFQTTKDTSLLPLLIHLVAAKCLGAERAPDSLHDIALHFFSGLDSNSFPTSAKSALSTDSLSTLNPCAIHVALLNDLVSAGDDPSEPWTQIPCCSTCFLQHTQRNDVTNSTPSAENASPPSTDLDYFSLTAALPGLPAQLDFVLTLIAIRVLSRFTRRLMGSHQSSPAYIYENFLAGSGTLRLTDQNLQITLAPPPLSIILRITGIDHETCTIPWLFNASNGFDVDERFEGREVCILPELN